MAVNSTTEEYHYTGEESSYDVCVSGINGVGIGLQSLPIAFDLGCECCTSVMESVACIARAIAVRRLPHLSQIT